MPLRAEIPEWDLRWPYAPAVRARNGISYLTARRFSAQNRLGSLQALKRLQVRGERGPFTPAREGALASTVTACHMLGPWQAPR
jgi:hypothetical protein